MKNLCLNKPRKGTALVVAMFVSIMAAMMTVLMMDMADTSNNQTRDNKGGLVAYYAAEAGVEEVRNYFNRNISDMGTALSSLPLPDSAAPIILANNSTYLGGLFNL